MSERIHSRINIATELAERAIRWTFEHLPTSDFGRSERVVNVAERCHQLVEGSFPPEFSRAEQPELFDSLDGYFGTNGYDSEGNYFDGQE